MAKRKKYVCRISITVRELYKVITKYGIDYNKTLEWLKKETSMGISSNRSYRDPSVLSASTSRIPARAFNNVVNAIDAEVKHYILTTEGLYGTTHNSHRRRCVDEAVKLFQTFPNPKTKYQ